MTTETPEKTDAKLLDAVEVQKLIPHRYPFLLVDQVQIVEPGKKAVGRKGVTMNEEFFQGHFPGQPIMPGVLIVEALAQTACVMLKSQSNFENKIAFFLGIESAKFRNPVFPGNILELEVEVLRLGGRAGKFKGIARVGDKVACEAQMSFVLTDKKS
jgi:3-hydroxyacyl-[acyl-carrier-protein] dehydratase